MGLGSVRGRKFVLSLKVKGRVLGICILCDTFVILLAFAPLLRRFRLNLYSLNILGSFGDHSFSLYDLEIYSPIVKLPDIFDFQDQIFIFRNFLCLSAGKNMGPGNCYVCYKCYTVPPVDEHPIRSVVVYGFISFDSPVLS